MTDPIVIQVFVAAAVILGALVFIVYVCNPIEEETDDEK